MTGRGDDKYGRIGGEGRGMIEADLKGRELGDICTRVEKREMREQSGV